MRITNSMLQQANLSQMQMNMRRIADAQQKVSTGLRLQKASDDPTAAAGSMQTRVSLRAVAQHNRSVELAASRTSREEDVLLQVTEVLTRAQMLATSQSTESATDETRQHAKAEVDQLFRQLVDFANTRFEGSYLFGGADGDTEPYTIDTSRPVLDYVSSRPTGQHTVEIADRRYLATNHNAVEVFEDTGVLQAVRALASGLAANDTAAIGASLSQIESAFEGVQSVIGDIGARGSQINLTRRGLQTLDITLQEYKSSLEEVDLEVAATDLVGRQSALQAAMLATSRVMGLSLADYLR